MKELKELGNYIDSNIEQMKRKQEEYDKLVSSLDRIKELKELYSGDLSNITESNNIELANILGMQNTTKLNNIIITSKFFDNEHLNNEEQVVNAKRELENILRTLDNVSKHIEMKVYKNSSKVVVNLSILQKYRSIFNNKEIIGNLEPEEFRSFLTYLKDCSVNLSKDEVLNLVYMFSCHNSENMERKNKVKSSTDILEDVNIIRTELENNGVQLVNINGLVNSCKFDLEERLMVYESAINDEEKWGMILYDMYNNLIPNYVFHQKDINIIFDEICKKYNNEYVKDTDINRYKINENDKIVIEKSRVLLNELGFEIEQYKELSEKDKNIIDSSYNLILDNNIDEVIDDRYSLVYVKFIKKLMLCDEYIKTLDTIISNEIKDKKEFGEREVNELIRSCISDIRGSYQELEILYNSYKVEINKDNEVIEEDVEDLSFVGGKNIFVFLDNSNPERKSYFEEDLNNVLNSEKKYIRNIENGFSNLANFDMGDRNSGIASRLKRIMAKSTRGIHSFVSDEVKPFRLRNSDTRIAFAMLPVSDNNKKLINQLGFVDSVNFNIILVLGFEEVNASKEFYTHTLGRIQKEKKQYKYLVDLFGKDLNSINMKFAVDLIESANSNLEDISNYASLNERKER